MMQNEIPKGATHVSDNGLYYKQVFHGHKEWWYVQHGDGGWYALSGKPTYSVSPINQ